MVMANLMLRLMLMGQMLRLMQELVLMLLLVLKLALMSFEIAFTCHSIPFSACCWSSREMVILGQVGVLHFDEAV